LPPTSRRHAPGAQRVIVRNSDEDHSTSLYPPVALAYGWPVTSTLRCPMAWRDPPNRSAEYRARADAARRLAENATDEEGRRKLQQDVDTWERMADYEDKHNPLRPLPGIQPERTSES
jgi:hypothetical protein